MGRYILLSILIGAVIITIRLTLSLSTEKVANGDTPKPQHSAAGLTKKNDISLINQTGSVALVMDKNGPKVKSKDRNISASRQSNSAPGIWSKPDKPIAVPEKYQLQGLKPKQLKVNRNLLSSLNSGDEISLSIPQLEQSYPMQIEQVEHRSNGDITFKGHVQNTEIPYSVIITAGHRVTFATINTPDGAFAMEAEGEVGWMTPQAELNTLIDTRLIDYKIPAISR